MNLAVINDQAMGIFATSAVSWPWWIWLLIVLGLILLVCLLPLLLLLCAQLRMHKRKASDSKSTVTLPTPVKIPNILVRTREMEANGVLERPSVLPSSPLPPPPSTRFFHTPSDSPSESIRSTTSHSRIAAIIKQQQPRTSWADHSIRDEIESRATLGQHIGICHLESVVEERGDSGKYEKIMGLESKSQSSPNEYYINQVGPQRTVHQQTTCEEKFFKKSDRQNRMLEEGYDRVQFTYTTPKRHFFQSEIV